jgi:hypothetical protein
LNTTDAHTDENEDADGSHISSKGKATALSPEEVEAQLVRAKKVEKKLAGTEHRY